MPGLIRFRHGRAKGVSTAPVTLGLHELDDVRHRGHEQILIAHLDLLPGGPGWAGLPTLERSRTLHGGTGQAESRKDHEFY